MLTDGVAVQSGVIHEGALPHVLQPASAMPGFPPPSRGDCNAGDKAIGSLPN
jgi:hypothetical protein